MPESFCSVDIFVLRYSNLLTSGARSNSDDMTSPTSAPGTNQVEKYAHIELGFYGLRLLLTQSGHRTGLEEFAGIDTTSDPLHYSTCNSESCFFFLGDMKELPEVAICACIRSIDLD